MELLITRSANETTTMLQSINVEAYADTCHQLAAAGVTAHTKTKDVDGTANDCVYAATRIPVARITQWRRSHSIDKKKVRPTINREFISEHLGRVPA